MSSRLADIPAYRMPTRNAQDGQEKEIVTRTGMIKPVVLRVSLIGQYVVKHAEESSLFVDTVMNMPFDLHVSLKG